ncbi:MAG TPA: hypothetical protein PLS90_00200 [Candidatus Sumerlaeota bacterium]|nr:hypothetical protein [Candidatus Sumerlaeota bacterium]HPK00853.1 hypothetical protein [Candidatus Sumerlaeota bacterium]
MRPLCVLTLALAAGLALTGCVSWPGGTDLAAVASRSGMSNVTTGDGTFENYTATGHYTGMDVGIAVGIPFLTKLFEIFPMRSNEELLGDVAQTAAGDGADAMINVTPAASVFTGFPFGILGIYVDRAEGTGIRSR